MNITCIICSDVIIGSSDIFTTSCGHIFHYTCLITWIERSKTCPQCRNRCTEKSIHRVYFNLANTDHIVDDVVTLQNKLDNMQFQLNLKEKDCKNYIHKYKTSKAKTVSLIEEVTALENKARLHDSVVCALKDQISYFKSRAREKDKHLEEIANLKKQLKDVESVQLAISGTRQDVNNMLKDESNVESLAILAAILKKTLLETERKKMMIESNFKHAHSETMRYKREINALEAANRELRLELETCRSTFQQEKEQLTSYIAELTKGSADRNGHIKRIFAESPLPRKLTPLNETNSPSIVDKVVQILDSDSPYLPVKTSSVGINFSQVSKKPTQPSLLAQKMSIFEKHVQKTDSLKRSKSEDVVYNGLGGQSKDDVYPSPKKWTAGRKRPKPSTVSSSKFRKLAPTSLKIGDK